MTLYGAPFFSSERRIPTTSLLSRIVHTEYRDRFALKFSGMMELPSPSRNCNSPRTSRTVEASWVPSNTTGTEPLLVSPARYRSLRVELSRVAARANDLPSSSESSFPSRVPIITFSSVRPVSTRVPEATSTAWMERYIGMVMVLPVTTASPFRRNRTPTARSARETRPPETSASGAWGGLITLNSISSSGGGMITRSALSRSAVTTRLAREPNDLT